MLYNLVLLEPFNNQAELQPEASFLPQFPSTWVFFFGHFVGLFVKPPRNLTNPEPTVNFRKPVPAKHGVHRGGRLVRPCGGLRVGLVSTLQGLSCGATGAGELQWLDQKWSQKQELETWVMFHVSVLLAVFSWFMLSCFINFFIMFLKNERLLLLFFFFE